MKEIMTKEILSESLEFLFVVRILINICKINVKRKLQVKFCANFRS